VTAFLGFAALRLHAKDESTLFLSVILVFWLFMSLANLGGFAGRDFWVGGWANIARYMYIPSTLLVIFASDAVGQILKKRTVLGAWLVSLLGVLSGLANFSYGVRHDLMVGHVQDFISTSLLIWPYPLTSHELVGFSLLLGVASLVYPFYRLVKHIGKSTKIPRRVLRDRTLEPRTRQHNLS
jgi:hypothetical protein